MTNDQVEIIEAMKAEVRAMPTKADGTPHGNRIYAAWRRTVKALTAAGMDRREAQAAASAVEFAARTGTLFVATTPH